MTAPLGYVVDYLATLSKEPPATAGEHQAAAAMLLRYAADGTRWMTKPADEAQVTALMRLARTHIQLAEAISADRARLAEAQDLHAL